MYGAILGDMIGAPFEFDRGNKTKDFPLFGPGTEFTDDSVMTIAVAEALMDAAGKTDEEVREAMVLSMQKWGRRYPHAGYGGMFRRWLRKKDPRPYGSFGNGSAMRVSASGWLFDNIEDTRRYARLSAEVTHNHPERIKGAEAVASAIFLGRCGSSKAEIREYIIREFGYDLTRTCNEIRPSYHHVETCQETVPEAITAFLEGLDFEDVIRTAVSLGGDCDTLTCIAGSMAEAYYEVPEGMKTECRGRLPEDLLKVLDRFEGKKKAEVRTDREPYDPYVLGNELIETAINAYYAEGSTDNLKAVVESVRQRMHASGHLLFPVLREEEKVTFHSVRTRDGREWLAAFTSRTELEKGGREQILSHFIDSALEAVLATDISGLSINPWGKSFLLGEELVEMIFRADGKNEYFVPDGPISAELFEDGSFLKDVVGICKKYTSELNRRRLFRILRDSYVYVPCEVVLSDDDYETIENMVEAAQAGEGLDSLIGQELNTKDPARLVPDILENSEGYFFPVFTSIDEMDEYGDRFSKIEKHFLEAVFLAKNNEKDIAGIVINAFSEPFVIWKDWFKVIEEMESAL